MKCPLALFLASWIAVAQNSASIPKPAEGTPPVVKPEDKCQVEGTVVNSLTGEPLKKVHLSLRPVDQQVSVPYGTSTDSAGHFLLDDVDPGRYSFVASRNGFVTQAYSPDGSARRPTTLTFAAGQNIKEIIFKLTPQGIIAGHIVDEDGEPLAGVMVRIMRMGYSRDGKKQLMPGPGANTNDLGEYRIYNLAPGKYIINAFHRAPNAMERVTGSPEARQAADEGYPTTYYPNATSVESAVRIEVTPGAQIQGIDMRMVHTRAARLRGRIVNLPPGCAQRTMVRLMPRDTTVMFMPLNDTRTTGHSGSFEMRGVTPGSYTLMAYCSIDDRTLSTRIPIEVGDSNIDKIELTLAAGGEIAGRLVIEGETSQNSGAYEANPTVNIGLTPKTGSVMGTVGTNVNQNRTFKMEHVNAEPYDINVGGLSEGHYLKSIRIGDRDVTETGADFTEAIPAGEMVVTISANGGQIDGTVQNEKSEPAAGASVVLIPDASHRSNSYRYKRVSTDQSGHFTIRGVTPGDYKVFAWEEVEFVAYQDPDFMKPLESKGEAISIKENAHEKVQVKAIPAESGASEKNGRN